MAKRAKQDVLDEYNGLYRRRPNIWTDPARDEFAFNTVCEHFGGRVPHTMLDIGCGSGHTIGYFHARWPGTVYSGLDLSEEAIKLARKRWPYATFLQGWLGEAALARYDLVTMVGVAEHFEDLREGLIAACETMSKNGVIYIEVPNCISYPTSEAREGFRPINQGNRQHEWHLYRESWENELRQAGLEIVVSKQGPAASSEFVWLVKHA